MHLVDFDNNYDCQISQGWPVEGAPQQDPTAEVCLQVCNPLTRVVGLSALHRPWRGSPWLRLKHSLKSHLYTPSAGRTTSWKSQIRRSGDWGNTADVEISLWLCGAVKPLVKVCFRHHAHQNYYTVSVMTCLYFPLWSKLKSVLVLLAIKALSPFLQHISLHF